ncbi:TetR/AcrR family transcriptional regulator [Streptomyces sp. NPDC006879]|uniref:TetR/AcrR family transcriptional regulator n=1 Tax=Streptomyces sp. NPDC006879 TaxID=3364767 RepID=UPI0036C23264
MVRMSAEERRESVIRAAMHEFARGGYHGTSTEAIAKRVGVSQPYLFRLFPNKQAIFQAAAERCIAETRRVMVQAADGYEPEQALAAMADAYTRMITEEPDRLLMQMQVYIAVSAAEAAGDHEFGAVMRAGWLELWESVHLPLGADVAETTTFMAHGMLINTLVALGYPQGHRVWAGFHPASRGVDPDGEGAG